MTKLSGTYVEVGRIILGTYFEPAKSYRVGFGDADVDFSSTLRTIGGQKYSDVQNTYRAVKLPFGRVSLSDKTSFQSMFGTVKMVRDFILCLDYTNYLNTRSYYGRFSSSIGYSHVVSDLYDVDINFEESL